MYSYICMYVCIWCLIYYHVKMHVKPSNNSVKQLKQTSKFPPNSLIATILLRIWILLRREEKWEYEGCGKIERAEGDVICFPLTVGNKIKQGSRGKEQEGKERGRWQEEYE